MDSFELNKIIGAILGTLLFVMGVGFIAEAIYEPAHGTGPGYDLPAPSEEPAGPSTGGPAQVADIGTLLAAADPKAGESAAKKCAACHDFTSGGPNKTGPNLYDVVERQIASHPGFSYSSALQAKASDTWTYENLNQWLISPKAFADGTKMNFAGVKDDKERANIIAFLSTLSQSPKPFPAPAAPAGGAASSADQTAGGASSAAPEATGAPSDASSQPQATAASSESAASSSSAAQ
ncbi:MAG TPA: cytochrome c family protein [Devosia sp.]|nr:cytochrome c family protein [Devosia sp.]